MANTPLIKKGFTLLEILIVIVIVGALAAIALPQLFTVVEKFRASEGAHLLTNLAAAQRRYSLDNSGGYADDIADLDVDPGTTEHFGAPTVANNPAAVASITRTGSYTLSIDEDTIISCTGGAGSICSKLGY